MDKRKSLINVITAVFFKIILLVLTLFTRRFLIKYVGNEANGVFSLYTSIIGFLAIADLGIGTAITFSMYKPIVDGDKYKISALYKLFIKVYRVIGIIILVGGLCILPALPYLAKDYSADFNLYYTFLLMLASIVITYFYSAKTSLINAYKNNYVTTTFHSIALIVEGILQLVLLYIFKSFELYLICKILSACLEWLLTEIYFKKYHKQALDMSAKLDQNTKNEVMQKTKAMFMHKIGILLVNTSDSIIISAFISVVILGKYSNYTTIVTAMNGVLALVFTPLTSIIGHLCVSDDNTNKLKYFNFFYGLNFIIGIVFYLGYYAIIDDVVTICFGPNLELTKDISIVITINYFIQFMRQSVLTFRDATGTFYNDRYKPLIEGAFNIILSISLVYVCGITGVIIATIITNLLICHTIEPYVLFKDGLEMSPKKYYFENYISIAIFLLSLVAVHFAHIDIENEWLSLLANGFIAVGISLIPVVATYIYNKQFREEFNKIIKKIFNIVNKKIFKRT